jgi:hypothetical protein
LPERLGDLSAETKTGKEGSLLLRELACEPWLLEALLGRTLQEMLGGERESLQATVFGT